VFKDIPGKKDFPGKQSVKSCAGALTFSVGEERKNCQPPRSASLLSLFQRRSLLSTGLCIQRDECGNSACVAWELWLVLRRSDFIVRALFLHCREVCWDNTALPFPGKTVIVKVLKGGFRNSSSLGKNVLPEISFPRPSA